MNPDQAFHYIQSSITQAYGNEATLPESSAVEIYSFLDEGHERAVAAERSDRFDVEVSHLATELVSGVQLEALQGGGVQMNVQALHSVITSKCKIWPFC